MTRRVCATVTFHDGVSDSERASLCEVLGRCHAGSAEMLRSHAGLHIEGSIGAGDLTWDFTVPDEAALGSLSQRLAEVGWQSLLAEAVGSARDALQPVAGVEAWLIEPIADHVQDGDLAGIKRTNLVRVLESANREDVERWSRHVMAFPDFVPAIRNWSFARTHPFGPKKPRVQWTHAWEQEFESLDGLLIDYMVSPYHWGWLDGWYDPEMPFCIMDPDLAHLYCPATESVLGWNIDKTQRKV
jgi:hypothetical protein